MRSKSTSPRNPKSPDLNACDDEVERSGDTEQPASVAHGVAIRQRGDRTRTRGKRSPTPTGFPQPGAAVSAYERGSCARPSSLMVTIVMVTVVLVAAVAPDVRLGCIANVRGGVGRKDPSMLESVRGPAGY